ncbi:MAG: LacI family transcriptional regulator, repressor for deo operon, udp, cdd, tsx, nupC, and nupG [Thermotogaceae bacterium]|nr:LacI family transcriptional regulator, repressor for deo operon, udp, cdd, tsx, nupC, and nupG [Thermotogaceae bacterium]
MKNKRITIKDVAKHAGVSISTVSRFMSNPDSVSEKLGEKIQKTIEKLNYHPNRIARSLRTGTTKLIGFLIPDITNPAFLLIVKGAEDYLKKRGYSFILGGANHSVKEETKLFKTLISQNVDGFIFIPSGNQNDELAEFLKLHNLKMVFVDRRYEEINAPYIGVDNTGGVEKMVDYLVRTGCKSFVYLCGEKTSSARERLEGFLKGVSKNRIKDYQILQGEFTFESGYNLVKKLENIPDAILGGNDLMAFGAIEALKEKGLSIPEDVSVTGFDDMFFSKYYKPALTTVRQPIYEMGKMAGRVLFTILSGKKIRKMNYILDTEIIIRDSSK